jgi:peptide/nickel transport system ATP-binding protein
MSISSVALDIQGLSVGYHQRDGSINTVVRDVNLTVNRGKVLGIAGESGCGKSTTALAAIGYRPGGMQVLSGSALVGDSDLIDLPLPLLRQVWGRRVVYMPQASTLALTPALTIGAQMAEPMKYHLGLEGQELRARQLQLLAQVGVPNPDAALGRYPHQFSGGQQQRINLAIALSCNPEVLILDEPTTGLDVTTQARIMRLLKRVIAEHHTAAVLVSHDLPLLAGVCDRLAIMYGGQIVEAGPAAELLVRPAHPYTRALLAAVPDPSGNRALSGILGAPPPSVVESACPFAPRCAYAIESCTAANPPLEQLSDGHSVRCLRAREQIVLEISSRSPQLPQINDSSPLLSVNQVWCEYRSHRTATPVVKDVSFEVAKGETLAIVGESGSGKSTLIRAIAGLHPWSSGDIIFEGADLPADAGRRRRTVRRDLQIIFQNPDMSLNPRHDVMSLIGRPMQLFQRELSRRDREKRIREVLSDVNLPQSMAHRYPGELSGARNSASLSLARSWPTRS